MLFDMKNFSSIICAIWIFTNRRVCSIIEKHPKDGPKPSFIPPAQLSLFVAKYQPYDTQYARAITDVLFFCFWGFISSNLGAGLCPAPVKNLLRKGS
jgi:hypothetical protein